uniref:Uncharacterized protein n=1 Tax=Oryza meridionalis TaxID=40149 RepID=A0A0E0EPW1_9ORYZ
MTESNPQPSPPPIQSEKRAPMTSASPRTPKVAKPQTSIKGHVPTRKSSPNHHTWCLILKTSQHSLVECRHTSPYKAWCMIHKSKSYLLTGSKIFWRLPDPRPASPAVRSTNAESNLEMHPWKICEMGTPDRLVGFIDIDPSVLHNIDDQESSGSNFPCEVNESSRRYTKRAKFILEMNRELLFHHVNPSSRFELLPNTSSWSTLY